MNPYFEIHVGIPTQHQGHVTPFLNDRWKIRSFEGFIHPPGRHGEGEHDVEAGATIVATRRYSTLIDVERDIQAAKDLLILSPGARIEVEAVLFKSGCSVYNGVLFQAPRWGDDRLIRQLYNVPKFESHIAMEATDGTILNFGAIVETLGKITNGLHELAYSRDSAKAIGTFFFSDRQTMAVETLRICHEFTRRFPNSIEQNVTMEQILICLAKR